MLLSNEAKRLSTLLRKNSVNILCAVNDAIERSIVGCNREVEFLRSFLSELPKAVRPLSFQGETFFCRTLCIHSKPIVSMGKGQSCELGDLLFVVKYHLQNNTIEKKSIVYQVKLSRPEECRWTIDKKQLRLLKDWPPFVFGWKWDGVNSPIPLDQPQRNSVPIC